MFKLFLINNVIRALTLGSKFILLLYLAKHFSPTDIGVYGIIQVSIILIIFLLGYDFYVFTTRELIGDEKNTTKYMYNQFLLNFSLYIIVLPFTVFLFIFDIISWKYITIFYILVILEHISQEFYRLLINLSMPIHANIVLFLRSGLWIYISIIILNTIKMDMLIIYYCWIVGSLLSILLSIYFLLFVKKTPLILKLDIRWIKKGVRVATPFLFTTIFLKLSEYMDRYLIQYFSNNEDVGIYTFFINIVNVIPIFVYTGVISILFPKLLNFYKNNNNKDFKFYLKKMTINTLIVTFFLSIILLLTLKPLLLFFDIENKNYLSNMPVFYVILLSFVFTTLSQVPHYILYIKNYDKKIFISTAAAFGMLILLDFILIPDLKLLGAAIGLLASNFTLFIIKTFFVYKTWNKRKGELFYG